MLSIRVKASRLRVLTEVKIKVRGKAEAPDRGVDSVKVAERAKAVPQVWDVAWVIAARAARAVGAGDVVAAVVAVVKVKVKVGAATADSGRSVSLKRMCGTRIHEGRFTGGDCRARIQSSRDAHVLSNAGDAGDTSRKAL